MKKFQDFFDDYFKKVEKKDLPESGIFSFLVFNGLYAK